MQRVFLVDRTKFERDFFNKNYRTAKVAYVSISKETSVAAVIRKDFYHYDSRNPNVASYKPSSGVISINLKNEHTNHKALIVEMKLLQDKSDIKMQYTLYDTAHKVYENNTLVQIQNVHWYDFDNSNVSIIIVTPYAGSHNPKKDEVLDPKLNFIIKEVTDNKSYRLCNIAMAISEGRDIEG